MTDREGQDVVAGDDDRSSRTAAIVVFVLFVLVVLAAFGVAILASFGVVGLRQDPPCRCAGELPACDEEVR